MVVKTNEKKLTGAKDVGRIIATVYDTEVRMFKRGQEAEAMAWAYNLARTVSNDGYTSWSVSRWTDARSNFLNRNGDSAPYRFGYVLVADERTGWAIEGLVAFLAWVSGEATGVVGLGAFLDAAVNMAYFGPGGEKGKEAAFQFVNAMVYSFAAEERDGVWGLVRFLAGARKGWR